MKPLTIFGSYDSTYKGISRIVKQVGGGRGGAWIASHGQSPARPHCIACQYAGLSTGEVHQHLWLSSSVKETQW
jgi:hypothetical protein